MDTIEDYRRKQSYLMEISAIDKEILNATIHMPKKYNSVEFAEYIMSDVLDSYDKLIQQRKECVDKYIRFCSIILQDGDAKDVKNIAHTLKVMEQTNIDEWEQEMKPLLEYRKLRNEYEMTIMD